MIQGIFAITRIYHADNLFPGYDPDSRYPYLRVEEGSLLLRMLWTFFVFFIVLYKALFYLRVYHGFGIIVELVLGTLGKIQYFLAFVLLINAFWALSYTLIGITYEETPEIYNGINTFLQVW